VWFLELNDVPISYQLVLTHNKRSVFLKTSYDSRFKEFAPGVFLMNNIVERIFREETAEEIDFITNLPFTRIWKPLVRKRTTIKIERNPILSKIRRGLFENPIYYKLIGMLEYMKWKKLSP
jgi:hypothetical protein